MSNEFDPLSGLAPLDLTKVTPTETATTVDLGGQLQVQVEKKIDPIAIASEPEQQTEVEPPAPAQRQKCPNCGGYHDDYY